MGLEFAFENKNKIYKLTDRVYDVIDLICIVDSLFRSMNAINVKGYVSIDSLTNKLISNVSQHLYSLGYEKKVLGNYELTCTM
jgi:hypothetical protein